MYYKELKEYKQFDQTDWSIELYDINSDGEKEILIYLKHPRYCGSHGCRFYILKKSTKFDDSAF